MSSAEIALGAHLYTRAVEEDIPGLVNSNTQDYGNLKLAMGDMSRWLAKKGAVSKDADGKWQIDNAGMDALGEEDGKAFLPYYQTAVMAHERAKGDLIRDGKSEYVKDFRELHEDTITEIAPETITRVRADDMQNIASTSLNLLDAVQKDPANAAFIQGLDSTSLDSLWNIMEQSGYLMPGENPDRTAPLGEQPLRGTPEQQDALVHQVGNIVSNLDIDLSEQVDRGNLPQAAAANLKMRYEDAHTEEVEIGVGSPHTGFDSDLMDQDCNTLYNVVGAFTRMAHTAQWDTQSVSSVLADTHRVDDLRVALSAYYDNSIDEALKSGNFGDPKIDPNQARRYGKAIDWMNEALTADMKSERFTGDDGGMMTQGGKAKAAARDFEDEISSAPAPEGFENAFDDMDAAATDTGRGTAEDPVAFDADADMAQGKYGRSDRMVRIPEPLVYEADMVVMEMLDSGTVEYLRQRAGRAEMDMGDIDSSKAAFGSIEDAMGQYRATNGYEFELGHRVITQAQKDNMNPEKRDRLRTARIEPGRGAFRGFDPRGTDDYVPGSADVAPKRLVKWIDDHMVKPDGSPNIELRSALRDMTQMQVEATHRSEGEAAIKYAGKFVERDRQEVEARKEAGREKRGLSRAEFGAGEIGRFLAVKEAAGGDEQVKVKIGQEGDISISHPDAPKLQSRLSETSENLGKALSGPTGEGREFGGMMSTEMLKAAYQTGAEKVSVLFDGETPYAAVGKLTDEPVRKKAKAQDIVLS